MMLRKRRKVKLPQFTWKQFKKAMKRQGVRNGDVIDYIDWHGNCGEPLVNLIALNGEIVHYIENKDEKD